MGLPGRHRQYNKRRNRKQVEHALKVKLVQNGAKLALVILPLILDFLDDGMINGSILGGLLS